MIIKVAIVTLLKIYKNVSARIIFVSLRLRFTMGEDIEKYLSDLYYDPSRFR